MEEHIHVWKSIGVARFEGNGPRTRTRRCKHCGVSQTRERPLSARCINGRNEAKLKARP